MNGLTLDEVAAELGVGKTSVEEWVKTRELSSFRKGRIRRVMREDLARFVLLNTVKARRPDWLTAPVETEFRKMLRDIVQTELNAETQRRGELQAA